MLSSLPHARKLLLFAGLSAADFGLTWYLLRQRTGPIHEANPLASWLLDEGGWSGLAAFKAATALVVVAAAFALDRCSRSTVSATVGRKGGYVLVLACAVLTLVVGWSAALSVSLATRTSGLIDPELVSLMQHEDQIVRGIDIAATYRVSLTRLSKELSEDRVRLDDAVAELASTERANDPEWQATIFRLFPMPTFHQALAAHLGHHALTDVRLTAPNRVSEVADRLTLAFHEAYPSPAVERTGLALFEPYPFPSVNEEIVSSDERNADVGATIKSEASPWELGRGRKRGHWAPSGGRRLTRAG